MCVYVFMYIYVFTQLSMALLNLILMQSLAPAYSCCG